MTDSKQIVKSESKAYGYNYASLADIVNQGFKLPIMETRNIDGETFMGWLDDKNQWHQGAPLIVPEMKGMNAAQMALGLACDDDAKLEKTKSGPVATGKVYGNKVDFSKIREQLAIIDNPDDLIKYWKGLKLSEKQAGVLRPAFAKRRAELGAKDE